MAHGAWRLARVEDLNHPVKVVGKLHVPIPPAACHRSLLKEPSRGEEDAQTERIPEVARLDATKVVVQLHSSVLDRGAVPAGVCIGSVEESTRLGQDAAQLGSRINHPTMLPQM